MDTSIIIWILIGISFSTYLVISLVFKKRGVHNLEMALESSNGLRLLNFKHLMGILLFGIPFYLLAPELRVLIHHVEIPRLHVLIPFVLVLVLLARISYFSFQKAKIKNSTIYHYNLSDAIVYFLIRFVFLFWYEFFFRGVLLFKFIELQGLFLAIIYSTTLYLLIHIFDSKKELLGTVPFGIVLCIFTYLTNSIWLAFFCHLTLSAVYEISIFFNKTNKSLES